MKKRLRVIHCSDIHLDGDTHGLDYYRRTFVELLDAARSHRPDVLLIAGDLFDANDATPETILWSMETLGRLPFPVVMIPGNHDCLDGSGIFQRYDFERIRNVDILLAPAGETRLVDGLDLAVWGKGLVDHTPEHRPLEGCPPRPAERTWYVGMGHGIYVPEGTWSGRSSPIHAHEIAASPCDYLALGHHHAALEVHEESTAAAYSGSPTDRLGRGATYACVDLDPGAAPAVAIHVVEGSAR